MKTISFCAASLLSVLIIHSTFSQHHVHVAASVDPASREALEIIIGGGGGGYINYPPAPSPEFPDCPPPPPPPPPECPPPPPPPRPLPSPPPSPKPRPPSPSPPPFVFASELIARVFPVIQRFRKRIKQDPFNITGTWEGPDICNKYKGFFCNKVPDRNKIGLAGVNFNGRNLGGPDLTLDGFIDKLPDVTIFHANSNNFTGTIPAKISKLRYLFELDLSNNNLDGPFPTTVLGATNLTFLDLRFNSFSGTVPNQVFTLDLDVLFINDNNLIQKLPDNLGSTPVLFLTLANNKFTGPIPKSIGRASLNLQEVLFLNNLLSGCLPPEIGLLSNATVFDVGFNQLTGPIPHSFQCLAKMELLNLARNQFYGSVPELVCKLDRLANFSLSFNYFTQVGPECRKLIARKVLDVRMNCILDLPMQRSAADCAAFFSKPKICPDERSLVNFIPCNNHGGAAALLEASDHRRSTAPAAAPRSYDALTRHRL